jgi:Domain of unknown function (DUF4335)
MVPTSDLTSLRYRAPTCSLEVTGDLSPLSQVAGQRVLKRLRFVLELRSAAGEPLAQARGMRSHLMALSTTVHHYVQSYLQTDSADAAEVGSLEGISLRRQGLTRHQLHLGNLVPRNQSAAVSLSASQLADLAEVLDRFAAEVAVLPAEPGVAAQRRRVQSGRQRWLGAAAAGVLITLGVGTLLPVLRQSSSLAPTATIQREDAPVPGAEQPSGFSAAPSVPAAPEPVPPAAPPEQLDPVPPASGAEQLPELPLRPSQPPAANQPPADAARPSEVPPAIASAPAPETAARASSEAAGSTQADSQNQEPSALAADSALSAVGPPTLDKLRASLQAQWQPPAELQQPLIYTLIIAETGELQAAVPQDAIAEQYRDRVPLPPLGTVVASPSPFSQRVRLTLLPSGEVTLL